MNADIDRAREIFIEAVGGVPPEQWDAFLGARCGADQVYSTRGEKPPRERPRP
jgi:hypothetical protein